MSNVAESMRGPTLSRSASPRPVAASGSVDTTDRPRSCPLCGATEAAILLDAGQRTPEGEGYRVVSCARCDLRYTRPHPTEGELAALYRQEYYAPRKPRLLSWDALRLVLHHVVLWQRRSALLDRRPGRVLDVGCGDGNFLASLKRRGWAVHGTDFSAAACELARGKGIAVQQGPLASAGFPDDFFDVVSLWHVLEHLSEPLAELAEIRRILRDDGLLVVEVPDSASATLRLCRERWFPLDVPRHLQHFTPATLEELLRRAGFVPLHRQHFHYLDFALAFISFVDRLGLLGRLSGTQYFFTDYRRATRGGRARFLALGLPLALLSLPYSVVTTLLTGHGEQLTLTARKGAP